MKESCRMCGIVKINAMGSIDPSLCKWCETSYERTIEHENGYDQRG